MDEHLQTGVAGIWALGDIVGKNLLKHSANLEAAYAAHNIFNPDRKVAVNYHAMPHAIFASPQVAGVGLTEQTATDLGIPYAAATYDYRSRKRPMIEAIVRSGRHAGAVAGIHSSDVLEHAWVVHEREELADVVRQRIEEHNRASH